MKYHNHVNKPSMLWLVQPPSHVRLCDSVDCSKPGSPVLHYLPEFVHLSIVSMMPSNHLILCRPRLLLLSILTQHRGLFQWISSSHQPKYWNFSFSIYSSNEYSGLISFRIDWLDFFAVQRTLTSLLQHNLKASILLHSAFMVQLSHLYTTTGKTIALTVWTFVSKVMWIFSFLVGRYKNKKLQCSLLRLLLIRGQCFSWAKDADIWKILTENFVLLTMNGTEI